jgi:hypothetical protein
MRGSGEKPTAAIFGTGSDFWLGRVPGEDVFEISRACQRTPALPSVVRPATDAASAVASDFACARPLGFSAMLVACAGLRLANSR